MNRIAVSPSRLRVTLVAGLGLALGLAAAGCGPQQKFCVDASDYVCRPIPDASPKSDVMDTAPQDMGSIYIGNDSGTTTDAGASGG